MQIFAMTFDMTKYSVSDMVTVHYLVFVIRSAGVLTVTVCQISSLYAYNI